MNFDWPHPIEAVFFDMDGTLLDSESLTHAAVEALLDEHGIEDGVDCTQFHGVTWKSIATTLQDTFPQLQSIEVANELSKKFQHALQTQTPPPILGAQQAVQQASQYFKTAVVSSSRLKSIHYVVNAMGLNSAVHHIVGAEDVQHSKPNPQCFQLAADHFGVSYERCLVFEDSMAGLKAGHNGGMATIAIGPSDQKAPFSTFMIENYTELPSDFFAGLFGRLR